MELDISENQISLIKYGGQQIEYSEMLSVWPEGTIFLGIHSLFFFPKMEMALRSKYKNNLRAL